MANLKLVCTNVTMAPLQLGSHSINVQGRMVALYKTTDSASMPRAAAVPSLAETLLPVLQDDDDDDDDFTEARQQCAACDRGHLCPDSWGGLNASVNIVPMSTCFNQRIWRQSVENTIENYARTIHAETSKPGRSGAHGCYVLISITLGYVAGVVIPRTYGITVEAWACEGSSIQRNGLTVTEQQAASQNGAITVTPINLMNGTRRNDAPTIGDQQDVAENIEADYAKKIHDLSAKLKELWEEGCTVVQSVDHPWRLEYQPASADLAFALPYRDEDRPYAALDYLYLSGKLDPLIREITGRGVRQHHRIFRSSGFCKFQVALVQAANMLIHGKNTLSSDVDGSPLRITDKNLAPQVDHVFPKGTWKPSGLDCFSNAWLVPAKENRQKSASLDTGRAYILVWAATSVRSLRKRGDMVDMREPRQRQKPAFQGLKQTSMDKSREDSRSRSRSREKSSQRLRRSKAVEEARDYSPIENEDVEQVLTLDGVGDKRTRRYKIQIA